MTRYTCNLAWNECTLRECCHLGSFLGTVHKPFRGEDHRVYFSVDNDHWPWLFVYSAQCYGPWSYFYGSEIHVIKTSVRLLVQELHLYKSLTYWHCSTPFTIPTPRLRVTCKTLAKEYSFTSRLHSCKCDELWPFKMCRLLLTLH